MTPEECQALPLGRVQVTHHFPKWGDDSVVVYADGKPVARLPATEVSFGMSYGEGLGYVSLKLIAGNCQIASRPETKR